MAKKKTTKKKSGKKKGSSKSSMGGFVDTNKLMGMAAGIFISKKLIPKIPGTGTLDPKILAAGKIIAGQWLPNQAFAKSALANDGIRNGVGDVLIMEGLTELMSTLGIAGLKRSKPRGNEFLAVSIEGLEDADGVNEDVLADDELGDDYEIGDDLDTVNDDLDTVNEDVLGDDDLGDDLDTVNEDVLGDDMEEDIL